MPVQGIGIPAGGLNARLQECSNKPPQPGGAKGSGGWEEASHGWRRELSEALEQKQTFSGRKNGHRRRAPQTQRHTAMCISAYL